MKPSERIRWLEKIFTAEIQGRLPFQSTSKAMAELVEDGWIEPMTRTFGRDRFGAITATGYQLTARGHITYCEWASKQPEGEPEKISGQGA